MKTKNQMHQRKQGDGVKPSFTTGKIPTANTVTNACHQDGMDVKNTVTTLVEKQQADSEDGRPCHDDVTLASSRTDKRGFYIPSGYTRQCDICGREYLAKRDTSKFCSGRCRQQAWLKNHPEIASAKNAVYRESLKARIEARGGRWIERE